jgi:hypothetical protein
MIRAALGSLHSWFRREAPPGDQPKAVVVDEFGLPVEWRRPEPMYLADNTEGWSIFVKWADGHGETKFPASVSTLERFLRDPPVRGPTLYEVWQAIDLEHYAHYWHTDANPVMVLRMRGTDVKEDGTVVFDAPWPPGNND